MKYVVEVRTKGDNDWGCVLLESFNIVNAFLEGCAALNVNPDEVAEAQIHEKPYVKSEKAGNIKG